MIEAGRGGRAQCGMNPGPGRGAGLIELQKGLEQLLQEAEAVVDRIAQPRDLRLIAESLAEIRHRMTELRQVCRAGCIAYPEESLTVMAYRFRDLEGRVKELRNDRESPERVRRKQNGEERPCRHGKKCSLWTTIKRLRMSFRRSSKPTATK